MKGQTFDEVSTIDGIQLDLNVKGNTFDFFSKYPDFTRAIHVVIRIAIIPDRQLLYNFTGETP